MFTLRAATNVSWINRVAVRSLSCSAVSFAKPSWATIDVERLSGKEPGKLYNLLNGEWVSPSKHETVIDPLNGEEFLSTPDTPESEIQPFIDSLAKVSKSGLHNPFKNPERYLLYGDVSRNAARALLDPEIERYFVRAIQRVVPKSDLQALNEVKVTRIFLENFCGDQIRMLARGFTQAGDRYGQSTNGYRWPYGPVSIIAPFNFPLEIAALQLMGALYMGNKPLLKVCSRVSMVMEQFIRLLHDAGMPKEDVDMIHCSGPVMNKLLVNSPVKLTQFTGSSTVAEKLAKDLHGRVKIEDAGFDWKILGPDVRDFDYVAWQADHDAYGASGQKCSAQSILFVHDNWMQKDLVKRLKELASKRNLADLSCGSILTVTNERIQAHIDRLLKIDGAKVLFGGKPLTGHSIPKCYGAFEPTAVFVPLKEIMKPENYADVTTEIFGPFQVITSYGDDSVDTVLEAMERMHHHLTAAIVSNDMNFVQKIVANTVNGTTYAGIRGRTTGAPQNHWFGPAGDPRGAGIGSPEAILQTWSCHREVVFDHGPIPDDWVVPKPN